jgi:hypothetical protein
MFQMSDTIANAVATIVKLTAPDVQKGVQDILMNVVEASYNQGMRDGIDTAKQILTA